MERIDTKRLRAKLLDLAVRGKLVPQDPNDEPASVLLERIRAERAELVKQKKVKPPKGGDSVIYRGSDGSHYEKRGKSKPVCIDEEIPFELPEGWEWTRIGSLCNPVTGNTPSTKNEKFYNGCYPFFRPTDLNQGASVTSSAITLTEMGYKEARTVPADSILVTCIGATIGKTGHSKIEGAFNQQINAIPAISSLCMAYIYYLICSQLVQSEIIDNASATTLPILNKNAFAKLLLPIPPLAEQQRIVEVLDKHLALVDVIEQSQSELDDLCTLLHSKILDLAVRGQLTEQSPSDEPASALLSRIREERAALVAAGKAKAPKGGDSIIYRASDGGHYEKRGKKVEAIDVPYELPEGWEWARLSSLVAAFGGKTPSKSVKEFWENGTVPWTTSKDVKVDRLYGSRICITELAAGDMTLVPPESVIVVTRSGILRRLLPVAVNALPTTVNQDLKAMVPFDVVLTPWLFIAIKGRDEWIRNTYHKDGTTVDSIDFDRMFEMPVPIPPFAEQRRIVERVNQVLSFLA